MRKGLTCSICNGMTKCKTCKGDYKASELIDGTCLDCVASVNEAKMQRRRATEVRKIMGSETYKMKKRWELSRVKKIMFNLMEGGA